MRKTQVPMPYHHTQRGERSQRPGDLDATIIDLRRRRQRRGRATLADNALIGYFPHHGAAIRLNAGNDVTVYACRGPLPSDFTACAALPWRQIGTITHRWGRPSFTWRQGVTSWLEDTNDLARKGLAAYYNVLKGHVLDPADGIVVTSDPQWAKVEITAS